MGGGAGQTFTWQNNQGDPALRHVLVDEKGEVWADLVPNTHEKKMKFAELRIVKGGVQEEMLDQIVVAGITLLMMEMMEMKGQNGSADEKAAAKESIHNGL